MTIRPTLVVRLARPVAIALLCVSALAASSQAARSARTRVGNFDPAEYAPYDSAGSGEITGTGSASAGRNGSRTIALRTVVLTPVTSWSRLWWERWVLRGDPAGEGEPRSERYLREAVADSSGRFRFEHLPAGEYFLRGTILFETGDFGRNGSPVLRVVLGKQVVLGAGQRLAIVLDSLRVEPYGSQRRPASQPTTRRD